MRRMTHLLRSLLCATMATCCLMAAPLAQPARPASLEVTIGAENDAAPWSYADGTGYVNDLVRAAFTASGWTVHYSVLPYARCKRMAQYGDLVGCFSTSRTPETEKQLQFPRMAVFAAANQLVVNADSPLTGCNRPQWGRRVALAVVHEYEYVPAVDALLASGDVQVEKVLLESSALRMLAAKRIDAALITTDAIKHMDYVAKLAGLKPDFKVVCDYGEFPAYLAFSRRHPQARAALQAFEQGMDALVRNGGLARLQREWADRALTTAHPEAP
jgi:polar amino acid transport system substrate-binding protein